MNWSLWVTYSVDQFRLLVILSILISRAIISTTGLLTVRHTEGSIIWLGLIEVSTVVFVLLLLLFILVVGCQVELVLPLFVLDDGGDVCAYSGLLGLHNSGIPIDEATTHKVKS